MEKFGVLRPRWKFADSGQNPVTHRLISDPYGRTAMRNIRHEFFRYIGVRRRLIGWKKSWWLKDYVMRNFWFDLQPISWSFSPKVGPMWSCRHALENPLFICVWDGLRRRNRRQNRCGTAKNGEESILGTRKKARGPHVRAAIAGAWTHAPHSHARSTAMRMGAVRTTNDSHVHSTCLRVGRVRARHTPVVDAGACSARA